MTNGSGGIPIDVQRTVIALLTGNTADLRELAKIAGRDASTFYRGAHLRSCDLTKTDLSDIDLTGSEKSNARMPKAYRRGLQAQGDSSPSVEFDVAKVIEEFRPHISEKEAEELELAYITDLLGKGDTRSRELAVHRFIMLIVQTRSTKLKMLRSVWAKLFFSSLTPSAIHGGVTWIDNRLMHASILSRLRISYELGEILKTFSRREGPPIARFDRDLIIDTALRAAEVSTSSEILIEIADVLSRHDYDSRTVWELALVSARDYTQAELVISRMRNFGLHIDVSLWNILLSASPTFRIGQGLLSQLIGLGVVPDRFSWNTLMKLAKDYASGRAVLNEMVAANIFPDATTYSILLGLAPSYTVGYEVLHAAISALSPMSVYDWNNLALGASSTTLLQAILGEMINAGITLEPKTFKALAKRIKTLSQATDLTRTLASHPALHNRMRTNYFGPLFSRIVGKLSASELLEWASKTASDFGVFPSDNSFESALGHYMRAQRFDDSVILALRFPYLDSSLALMRDPSLRDRAEAYFLSEYETGKEPHNAARALAHLYLIVGDTVKVHEWVGIAKSYPDQHPRRIEMLNRLLKDADVHD